MSCRISAKRLLALLLLGLMLVACDSADEQSNNNVRPDGGFLDVLDDATSDADLGDAQGDGASEDSVSEDGVSEDGVSEDGESEDGMSEDGMSEDGESEDGESEDGVSDADTPDSTDPVDPSEARGELDITFATGQPTPGLFVGPADLRADPSALMKTEENDVITAGRGRMKGEDPAMFAMRLDEAGALDFDYGSDGVQTLPLAPADREILVLAGAMQADGKSVVCGNVRGSVLGRSQLFVARLNPDGSPDMSFGDNAQMRGRAYFDVPADAPNSLCWALQVLPDESILVGGQIAANNTITPLLMRLHPDGTLDTSFGASGDTPGVVLRDITPDNPYLYAQARELTVLENGKILALIDSIDGTIGHKNGYLMRFQPDGSIDEQFGENVDDPGLVALSLPGDASHQVYDFTVESDTGRILVVGQKQAATDSTQRRFFVHALDSNGAVDPDFADAGTYILDDFHAEARAIAVQDNGKILAVGSAMTNPNPAFQSGEVLVVRLLADGTVDASFAPEADTPGVFVWEHPSLTFYAARAALDSLGRVIIVGSSPDDPNLSPRGHGFVMRVR